MWIIGIFLRGQLFPSGKMTKTQYKYHVFNIVDFVTRPTTLDYMLDFDAEAFF